MKSVIITTTATHLQMTVTKATFSDVSFLIPLTRGTVVNPTTDKACTWWLAQHDGKLIGAVCAKDMGGGKFRMRCDIVVPEYRKQGVYNTLSNLRENWCRAQHAVELNCFSSQYSRGTFERMGYVVDGNPEKDNIFMRKSLKEDVK